MPADRYLFFFRVYNDIDHIAPIAWKMDRLGHQADVILIDKNRNIHIDRDPRLRFLTSTTRCHIRYYYALSESFLRLPNINFLTSAHPIFNKMARSIVGFLDQWIFTEAWAKRVLLKMRPKACVFDIQQLEPKTIEGKFMTAAKKLSIPLIATPHGLNSFVNFDWTDEMKLQARHLKKPTRDPAIDFIDAAIEQNPDQFDKMLLMGYSAEKVKILGSTRFCDEWIKICKEIFKPYCPTKEVPKNSLKVIFFLPRWDQRVRKELLFSALEELISIPGIFLVIKEHTREGAGELPQAIRKKLLNSPSVELIANEKPFSIKKTNHAAPSSVQSFSLALWADVIINFGSSIGLDALQLNRLLINPSYLHENQTVFETYRAGIETENIDELIAELKNFRDGPRRIPYDARECLNKCVYGGKGPHDVLQEYCHLMIDLAKSKSKNV